jgi:hypothetical protein
VIDYETTVAQLLDDVCAVGLASKTLDSAGRYSVVRDLPQATAVQLFTPRNSWGFTGRKAFPDLPDAFRVRYIDGNGVDPFGRGDPSDHASWAIEELLADSPRPQIGPTPRYETLEFRGVTAAHHAWALAQYHHRIALLRPEVWELNCDVENLICSRGDRVRIAHDVLLAGLGWGRVKTITIAGPNMTAFVSDEAIFTEIGKTYRVIFRDNAGGQTFCPIVSTGTVSNNVTFTTPQPIVVGGGELFAWGQTANEVLDAMVKAIDPGPDFTARLTLVPYNEAIYVYDLEFPVPPFDPHISIGGELPPWQRPGPPPPPVIHSVQSDESVLVFGPGGTVTPRIVALVSYTPNGMPSSAAEFVYFHGQISTSPSTFGDEVFVPAAPMRTIEFLSVQAGGEYAIRVRTASSEGVSEWVYWQDILVTGRTSRPPDVPVLAVQGRSIRWSYPNPPLDLAGFRLRRHIGTRTVWEDAQPLHDGLLSTTISIWPIDLYDVTATYLIKAVNTSGLESWLVAYVTATVPSNVVFGDRLVPNLLEETDLQALGYPGLVTGGIFTAGHIIANTLGLFWSEGDTAAFWHTDAALFWVTQYGDMTYEFSATPDADQVPCSITVSATVTAQAWAMDYRTGGEATFWARHTPLFWGADADLMWADISGAWLPWPGTLQALTRQRYEFLLRTVAGPTQGVIDLVLVTIDVPDIREQFPNIAIAAVGTRMPITASYRAIKLVQATLVNDGGNAVFLQIVDKGLGGPVSLGPLITAADATSALVAGHADVEIIGY